MEQAVARVEFTGFCKVFEEGGVVIGMGAGVLLREGVDFGAIVV